MFSFALILSIKLFLLYYPFTCIFYSHKDVYMWVGHIQDGQDTDADASLIMFSNHGQPVDSLYHLVRLSQDGSIKHMGDTGEEVEAESFMFHFSEVSQVTK